MDTQCGAYCESGEKESVTLFKPLEMRTSADRDESYPRIDGVVNERRRYNGATGTGCIYASERGEAGVRAVPSFGRLFVSCIIRACARAHAHIRARERERKKCAYARARTPVCMCVCARVRLYCVASVPGV